MSNILKELNNPSIINNSISVVESIRSSFKRIPHNHINVLYALKEIMKDDCKNYLEIGTLWGGSLGTVIQSPYPSNFYAIDLFEGHNGEINSIEIVKKTISGLNKNNYNYELIKGDCSVQENIDLVKSKIPDGVDLFFIDGDHSTQAVIRDFNNYKDIVNPRGYVVFDDYGFLPEVKAAVDQMDFTEFEKIGRINLGEGSSNKNSLYLRDNLHSSYIIKKK